MNSCAILVFFAIFVSKSLANVVVTSHPMYISKNQNVIVLKCIPINGPIIPNGRVTFSANNQILYDSSKDYSASNVKKLNNTWIEVRDLYSELTNVKCTFNDISSINPFFVPYINVERYEHNPRKFVINQKFAATCSLNMRPYDLVHPSKYQVHFMHNGTTFARYSVENNNVVNFESLQRENQGFKVERGNSIYPDYSVWVNPHNWWADGSYRCSISVNTTIKIDSDEIDANTASLFLLSTITIVFTILLTFFV